MNAPAPFQFGLSSLLLITTFAAVIMSVSVTAPPVGIFLAVVSLPALLRTYLHFRRQYEEGKPVSNWERAVRFLLHLGVGALIGLATCTVFLTGCLIGLFVIFASGSAMSPATGLAVGIGTGTCVSLPLLIHLLRLWFKYPREKRGGKIAFVRANWPAPSAEPPPGVKL